MSSGEWGVGREKWGERSGEWGVGREKGSEGVKGYKR